MGLRESDKPPGEVKRRNSETRFASPSGSQEDTLSAITARYARKLPDKIRALGALVEQLKRTPDDPVAHSSAQKAAHQLAGTAGSYGFQTVSELARRLERMLDRGEADWPKALGFITKAQAAAGKLVAREPAEGPGPEPRSSDRLARLLVVDDDENFLDLVRELGRRQLIEVVCARTSAEARALVETGDLDGALLDVWLGPEEASFDLAQELVRSTKNTGLPVAFISSDGSLARRVSAAHAGGALFLSKPLTEGRLVDTASQLVAIRRGSRARILLVDDDADFLARTSALLREAGLRVTTLSDGTRVLATLDAGEHDALVVDVSMPNVNGTDLVRIVRTNPRFQDLPIIVVTSAEDESVRLEAIRAGCDDYIGKPVSDAELCARVKARVERQQLMRAHLERDPLTGLTLRRGFMERLRSRVSEAQRRGTTVAVCMLDLDHFKEINDEHGHISGDRVLANLGRLLAAEFREEDLRARWGGEEFALAFPHQTAAGIGHGIEELLEDLRQITFVDEHGSGFHASFSAGLAEYPADGLTCEELIAVADRRLYQAKALGRSRVVSS